MEKQYMRCYLDVGTRHITLKDSVLLAQVGDQRGAAYEALDHAVVVEAKEHGWFVKVIGDAKDFDKPGIKRSIDRLGAAGFSKSFKDLVRMVIKRRLAGDTTIRIGEDEVELYWDGFELDQDGAEYIKLKEYGW